jgi:hypothetical protein
VGFPIELDIAARVKCPLHGQRFKPPFHIYVPDWLREKLWKHLATNHSAQYRKAWYASFPSELWPAEEVETPDGKVFLKLKDGTRILAFEPDWQRKPLPYPIDPELIGKPLTEDEARVYLQRTKGDVEAAEALATAEGRTF